MRRVVLAGSMLVTAIFLLHPLDAGARRGKSTEAPAVVPQADLQAAELIGEHVQLYRPLYLESGDAFWEAMTTGSEEAFDRKTEIDGRMRDVFADTHRFTRIRALLADTALTDVDLRRQLEMLERLYLRHQIPDEPRARINVIENEVDWIFTSYRMTVGEESWSMADVERTMNSSRDGLLLEEAWKASKKVGEPLLPLHQELVGIRNGVARDLGYADWVELALRSQDFDPAWLEDFFAEVERATDEPFRQLKEDEIDPFLAERFGIPADELMPWHYGNPYFQDVPPGLFEVDLDALYARRDHEQVVADAAEFFQGIGMPADSILARSDLYPREGKNPHAMAHKMDLERADTAILLMNLPLPPATQNRMGTSTLLHELGHCVHYEGVDLGQPYLFLDVDSQTTEALAMMLERQVVTVDWLTHFLGVPDDEARQAAAAAWKALRAQELIFARWCLVIYHWEKDIYANPDQDWGDAWWRYKERFQGLKRPADWSNPDPLGKYHLATASATYYNNYAVGSFVAAQVAAALADHIGQDVRSATYRGDPQVGAWLIERYTAPGARRGWLELVEQATGAPLGTEAWRRQFVDGTLPAE